MITARDADYWRHKAAHCRSLAKRATSKEVIEALRELAEEFEQMAHEIARGDRDRT